MTKKNAKLGNLTWKLKELPTASELADLVRVGALKPHEVRKIVVGSAEDETAKIKALEELVEYLQGLVTELAKRQTNTFVPYERTVYIDRSVRPYWDRIWMNTNTVLAKSGLQVGSTSSKLTTATSGTGIATFKANPSNTGAITTGYSHADYSSMGGSSVNAVSMNSSSTQKFDGNAITLSVSKDGIS